MYAALKTSTPESTETRPLLLTGIAIVERPAGVILRSVPKLLNAAEAGKKASTWAPSGSKKTLPARLFQTEPFAKVNELARATVAVPALLTVLPSRREKNP